MSRPAVRIRSVAQVRGLELGVLVLGLLLCNTGGRCFLRVPTHFTCMISLSRSPFLFSLGPIGNNVPLASPWPPGVEYGFFRQEGKRARGTLVSCESWFVDLIVRAFESAQWLQLRGVEEIWHLIFMLSAIFKLDSRNLYLPSGITITLSI